MTDRLYVGQLPDGTDVKLDVYEDGTHEVAVRDMDSRRWGIPVALTLEPVARRSLAAAELVAQVKAEAEAERLARLEAGLARWGG